jgi:hypothetical protein
MAVIAVTLISILIEVGVTRPGPTLDQGIDSAQSLSNTVLTGRIVGSILVALYVIWYANRAPARAFYRGYYEKVEPMA